MKKDYGVFAVPVVALFIAVVSFVTIDDSQPGVLVLMHIGGGIIGLVMAVMSFSFALRWNAPDPPRPLAQPGTGAAVSSSGPIGQSPGDHLHTTLGTAGVGGDMAAVRLGVDPGTSDCGTDASFDSGCDSGGADSGGHDSGGGYDSGGGGWS